MSATEVHSLQVTADDDQTAEIIEQTQGSPRSRAEQLRDAIQTQFAPAPAPNDSGSTSTWTGQPVPDAPNYRNGQTSEYQGTLDVPTYLPEFKWRPTRNRTTFTALQEWEGYVLYIGDNTFTARLCDLTSRSESEEAVEFPLEDLSEDDRSFIRPGAVFRWSIGYQHSMGGTTRRVSQVVFRRLPRWTRKELEENRKSASQLGSLLRGDGA